ncbi:MAG: hypothetical protein WCZ86_09955 [Desulfurivibrionaceae bacterium]|jgi:hypothetical protein
MSERQIHCEPAHEAAAGSIMPNTDKIKKMPDPRQPECNDFSNDEVRRDRYRMR